MQIKNLLKKVLQNFLLFPIITYRYTIAPFLPERCRFVPTCSAYAMEAVQTHGPLIGVLLILRRLGRCQPFSGGHGYDPVPPKRDLKGTLNE